MSDEYEYGPWIEVPEGGLVQLDGLYSGEAYKGHVTARYRIATPKPKRELVVGKWYCLIGGTWSKAIAIDDEGAWLAVSGTDVARFWPNTSIRHGIDWSTPPRDEASE
jgi:hypothetical protein